MPKLYLGQVVLWRHSRTSAEPAPAIVTRVGQSACSVLIFPVESKVGLTRDGVRHETDPDLARITSDAGVWDYTEGDRPSPAQATFVGPRK